MFSYLSLQGFITCLGILVYLLLTMNQGKSWLETECAYSLLTLNFPVEWTGWVIYQGILKVRILISFFFCCKLVHISWLQITQRCYLTVLEARFLNKSCWVKMKMSAVLCSFLNTLGVNLFSCHFQLLEPICILCSWPTSIFKAGNSWLWLSHISLLWSLCLPLPHLKTLVITLAPSRSSRIISLF